MSRLWSGSDRPAWAAMLTTAFFDDLLTGDTTTGETSAVVHVVAEGVTEYVSISNFITAGYYSVLGITSLRFNCSVSTSIDAGMAIGVGDSAGLTYFVEYSSDGVSWTLATSGTPAGTIPKWSSAGPLAFSVTGVSIPSAPYVRVVVNHAPVGNLTGAVASESFGNKATSTIFFTDFRVTVASVATVPGTALVQCNNSGWSLLSPDVTGYAIRRVQNVGDLPVIVCGSVAAPSVNTTVGMVLNPGVVIEQDLSGAWFPVNVPGNLSFFGAGDLYVRSRGEGVGSVVFDYLSGTPAGSWLFSYPGCGQNAVAFSNSLGCQITVSSAVTITDVGIFAPGGANPPAGFSGGVRVASTASPGVFVIDTTFTFASPGTLDVTNRRLSKTLGAPVVLGVGTWRVWGYGYVAGYNYHKSGDGSAVTQNTLGGKIAVGNTYYNLGGTGYPNVLDGSNDYLMGSLFGS